jgi:hypothetical protein
MANEILLTDVQRFIKNINAQDVSAVATYSQQWAIITNNSETISMATLLDQFEADGFICTEGNRKAFFVAKPQLFQADA